MTMVFSRRDAGWLAPSGAGDRRYLVAPLTFRERQAFRADLAREGGLYPPPAQMLDALRAAVREVAPQLYPPIETELSTTSADATQQYPTHCPKVQVTEDPIAQYSCGRRATR